MLETGLVLGVCAMVAMAALQDICRLQISNLYPVAVVLLFVAWLFAVGFDWSIWQNLAVFLFTLAIGTFAFARGVLGGGDVKLLAAVSLWFDLTGSAAFFLYTAIGGAILTLLFIIARRLIPAYVQKRTGAAALQPRGPIPYGVAIAAGAILALSSGAMNPDPDHARREMWRKIASTPLILPAPNSLQR
jgi:prepilin peptidase CpaA